MLMPASALAADVMGDPSNYRERLSALNPGDRLLLSAGSYDQGLSLSGLNGTESDPIIIEGPQSGARAIILGRSCCNTISIRDSSYVQIKHLDVDAQGLLVDGLKAEGDSQFAHHITVEGLHIYNLGNDQQIVGINTKCPAWDWVIKRQHHRGRRHRSVSRKLGRQPDPFMCEA